MVATKTPTVIVSPPAVRRVTFRQRIKWNDYVTPTMPRQVKRPKMKTVSGYETPTPPSGIIPLIMHHRRQSG